MGNKVQPEPSLVQVTLPKSDLEFVVRMLNSESERLFDKAFYGGPHMHYTERDSIQALSYKIEEIARVLNEFSV